MPEFAGKKLGVLLTTAPEHANFRPAVALMNAALDAGVRVYLYCIDDAVKSVATPEIQGVKARGASVFGCAYGAHRRRMPVNDLAAWSSTISPISTATWAITSVL